MTREEKAKAYDEALERAKKYHTPDSNNSNLKAVLEQIFPKLAESEDENLKNKSGYYKAGKFWKASTLWNAVKGKSPQKVPNRYILQECTWNISSLQHFADEVKNVQEVNLDYPIILDMNGNILDGAHRVVKAYLEGKDIDIVYLGDDEWPEPDYDEEKAVKESEDERIRKFLVKHVSEWIGCIEHDLKLSSKDVESEEELAMFKAGLAYLEKQKENPDSFTHVPENAEMGTQEQKPVELSDTNELVFKDICKHLKEEGYNGWVVLLNALRNGEFQPKQEWSEEDEAFLKVAIAICNRYSHKDIADWLESLRPQQKTEGIRGKSKEIPSNWKPSEEQMEALEIIVRYGDKESSRIKCLRDLIEQLKQLM